MPTIWRRSLIFGSAVAAVMTAAHAAEGDYSWRQPHAAVHESGDLEWKPEPFAFVAGEVVRYIDYENGDDANAGTREAPWQHHPWDGRAGGQAANASGPITYVFKRGVTYRIDVTDQLATLVADESGERGNPIRLTSDPDWGEGEAVIAGSQPVAGTWRRATADGAPERLPVDEHEIWVVDFDPDFKKKRHDRYAPNEAVLFSSDSDGQ
ncbi:MAG: hypothetical protein ACOCXA_04340, partial [Planctomycetota bacterium]